MNLAYTNDEEFIRRLTEIVESNLENEKFGVSELVLQAGLSNNLVRKRIRTILKKTISQFINEIRLNRALDLLQQSTVTASEVAYSVGFGSPSYFVSCFHRHFGYPPGEARKLYLSRPVTVVSDENSHIHAEQFIPDVHKRKMGWLKRHRTLITASVAIICLMMLFLVFNHSYFAEFRIGKKIPSKKSVVVLPFKNFTYQPENPYFAEGLMEDILNNLSKISDLRVISRTTSDHFRDSELSAREIAREVHARNVLEGSVRQEGNKVRITIQLIDAYHDSHFWSENYDRELTDILGIQGEIAIQVANKLNAVLSEKEISQIRQVSTKNPLAYDNYLRGRFLLNRANSEQRVDFNLAGLKASLNCFEKAIEEDENFAQAYAGLANAWFNLSAWGWHKPYEEGIQKARDYTKKALEIDAGCAEAHAIKGAILIWPERKFEDGRKELLLAVKLDPHYSFAHQLYAQLLMITGTIEEARKQMNLTIEQEPYFWVVRNLDAWIYYFEEKHDKAIEACIIARDLNPDYIFTHWLLFLNHAKLGNGEQAVSELQTIARNYPASSQLTDEILNAYKKSGIPGLFTWLTEVNIHKPVAAAGMSGHPFWVAWWFAILGDRDQSIFWLEKNMESQSRQYTYFNLIATNPDFDLLRDDPRFISIIDQIGLTPYHTRKPRQVNNHLASLNE